MSRIALALPIDDAHRLVSSANYHGHDVVAECSGAAELAARVRLLRPDAVVVAALPQYLDAELVAAADRAGSRLVVFATEPTERRLAASLGLIDVIDGQARWEALDEDVIDALPVGLSEPVRVPPTRGRVVAVWGPGAPGRTTIAITLAAELADLGASVTLADADTHAASVAPSLGLLDEAPGFAAACRLAGAGALTREEFERIAQTHRARSSAFRVLTGLGRPSRWPEVTAERVTSTLDALREWNEITVVDVAASLEHDEELSSDLAAPRRNAATAAALAEADIVVAVGAADPIGLARFLRGHAELLELVDPERVIAVINRLRAGAIGLSPASQVRQTLLRFGGIDDPVLVPHDLASVDAALLGARTIGEVAPRSPLRIALRRFAADRLVLTLPPEPEPHRLRRRATARLGRERRLA